MAEQAGEPRVGGAEEIPSWVLGSTWPQLIAHRLLFWEVCKSFRGCFALCSGANYHSPKAIILFSIVCLAEMLWFGGA